jgi:hypothetical protein
MSTDACVCSMPSSPESQHAMDGMSRSLVQVATITAPISSGARPLCSSAARAASRASCSIGRAV